jgi:signal transduction histidine kinase
MAFAANVPSLNRVIAVLRRVKERIEASCARLGLTYPWWIPAYSTMAFLAISIAAFAQRASATGSPVLVLALVLTLAPTAVWTVMGWLAPPWIEAIAVSTAVALYLTHPVQPDLAPLLCLLVAGEIAATMKLWIAMLIATADIGILLVASATGHLESAALYVIGVVLGADVGIALRWQMRALAAERANTAIVREQAMLAERQRLAREVHDVIGHSLSINLLHVTAARHALQQHNDIADAVESLAEAERVGRTAMGDLRRTVSVLSAEVSEKQPLPGITDIPALIEQCRFAGLDVTYSRSGEFKDVGDVTSLGVYRILQESLANIAKHAPTSSATVALDASPDGLHLAVRNTLRDGQRPSPGDGTGLTGMAARATQMGAELRAGVDGDTWLVDVVVPLGTRLATR